MKYLLALISIVAYSQTDCNIHPEMCWNELIPTKSFSTPLDGHKATGDVFCAAQYGGASFGWGNASPIGYWDVDGFTKSKLFVAKQNGTSFSFFLLIGGVDYFTSTGTDVDWCCSNRIGSICISGTASVTLPFIANGDSYYKITIWQRR